MLINTYTHTYKYNYDFQYRKYFQNLICRNIKHGPVLNRWDGDFIGLHFLAENFF